MDTFKKFLKSIDWPYLVVVVLIVYGILTYAFSEG